MNSTLLHLYLHLYIHIGLQRKKMQQEKFELKCPLLIFKYFCRYKVKLDFILGQYSKSFWIIPNIIYLIDLKIFALKALWLSYNQELLEVVYVLQITFREYRDQPVQALSTSSSESLNMDATNCWKFRTNDHAKLMGILPPIAKKNIRLYGI